MTPVEVEVEGLAAALDRFAQGDQQVGKALVRATRRAVAVLRRKLAKYPEERPESNYRRTGTLGRRWTTRVQFAGDVAGLVGNNVPYAPYVQDADRQAQIHRGLWQTAQEVAQGSEDEVVDIFADEIANI